MVQISVIVVTYNHEKTIKETIDSILEQQTSFEVEIIVGEDCSMDKTLDICLSYKDRIKLITSENNVGMMPNFIRALKAAKGKYIAICDGDDYWTDPLKLQKQFNFLENNLDFGLCFHPVDLFDAENNVFKEDNITLQNDNTIFTEVDLAKGNFIHSPTVLLKNDFEIPNGFEKLPMGDWPLYMLQLNGRKIKKINSKMAIYRVHNSSSWNTKSMISKYQETNKVIEFLLDNSIPGIVKRELLKTKKRYEKEIIKRSKIALLKRLKLFFKKN